MLNGLFTNTQDVIARLHQLEKSLQWERSGNDYRLVSLDSKRILATVACETVSGETLYKLPHPYNNRDTETFTNEEAALAYAKFQVIRNLLGEDLRRAIQ